MYYLKRLTLIINLKTLVVTALAILSTFICRHYNFTADFPLTLITIAIVFPIVFSIGGAYKRREAALDEYGGIKAHGRSIYFAARDWLADSTPELQQEIRTLLGDLLKACRTLFAEPVAKMTVNEKEIYKLFSQISLFIKKMRNQGLATGEVSRCNQYLSKTVIAFESIKHIYQYRTPRTLRAYSYIFIILLPILYGPYFAHVAKEVTRGLEYFMPILFSVILVCLDNIQTHLENPFDQIGEDDVMINAEKFVNGLEL